MLSAHSRWCLYLPEDINITSGSARYHRSFLDIYLSQFSKKYLLDLIEYQKILKQRNALLKKLKKEKDKDGLHHLDVWDESLVKPALKVMAARREFVDQIKPRVKEISTVLSNSQDIVEIVYHPRMEITDYVDPKGILDILRKERSRDIIMGVTMLGPHRDVMDISIGGEPLRPYGSLGQKKTVMIAMKLAALEIISEQLKEPAILILDEAFAQLDPKRSNALLGLLSRFGQVFLASASEQNLNQDVKAYEVLAGKVKER